VAIFRQLFRPTLDRSPIDAVPETAIHCVPIIVDGSSLLSGLLHYTNLEVNEERSTAANPRVEGRIELSGRTRPSTNLLPLAQPSESVDCLSIRTAWDLAKR
jgi:hypothetical protein